MAPNFINNISKPLPEVEEAIRQAQENVDKKVNHVRNLAGGGSGGFKDQFSSSQTQPQQIQNSNNNSSKYPSEGAVILVYFDGEIKFSNEDEMKDEYGFLTQSSFKLVKVEDYEDEKTMKSHVMEFNDMINRFRESPNGSKGDYFIFVARQVQNVVKQVEIQF